MRSDRIARALLVAAAISLSLNARGETPIDNALLDRIPAASFSTVRTPIPKKNAKPMSDSADSVNLIVVGSAQQLIDAFGQARWRVAEKLGIHSSLSEAVDAVMRRSYPTAPVSTQYLFHKPQDLAFELEEGDATHRHHVRFWSMPGHPNVWIGAASEDVGVLIDVKKRIVSHRVNPKIDVERGLVEKILVSACGEHIRDAHLNGAEASRLNAQGIRLSTDGETSVLSLQNCAPPKVLGSNCF